MRPPTDPKLIEKVVTLKDRHSLDFKAIADRVGMRPASVARIYRAAIAEKSITASGR